MVVFPYFLFSEQNLLSKFNFESLLQGRLKLFKIKICFSGYKYKKIACSTRVIKFYMENLHFMPNFIINFHCNVKKTIKVITELYFLERH